MRTRVKFCGIVRPQDAQIAASLGADAIGAVLYPQSPSAVSAMLAAEIFRLAPPPMCAVALFVNAEESFVREVISRARPSVLQFHGDENAAYCESFGMPYIKAQQVRTAADAKAVCNSHPNAAAVLLDAAAAGKYGGSGETFDWNCIPQNAPKPVFAAGGLTAQNVGKLIAAHRPWAVDVSGGIAADGDRRRKEYDKMCAFMKEVQNADCV